jgi:hypothetical protein
MKSISPMKKGEQQSPKSRGEVAQQEQIRILREALSGRAEGRVPQTRGEVARQEQVRILREALGD